MDLIPLLGGHKKNTSHSSLDDIIIVLLPINIKNMTTDQLEFSTFCIGNVAEALDVSELDAYVMLLESGLLKEYIVKYYDILHTYSRRYITEDLTSLLRERGIA